MMEWLNGLSIMSWLDGLSMGWIFIILFGLYLISVGIINLLWWALNVKDY